MIIRSASDPRRTPTGSGQTPVPDGRRDYAPIWICIALFLLVGGLFSGSIRNGFVNYDDNDYVFDNYQVQQGLGWGTMVWALVSFEASNWHPVTWLSHAVDCELYGLNPAGHHLTNVLLHGLNTALVFLLLFRLTGAVWRSALVALFFGVHPSHVESVAWISERKDMLSTLFLLLMLLAYVRYTREVRADGTRRKLFFWLTVVLFVLGLMAKPMLVTAPFLLLLLDYWPLARLAGMAKDLPEAPTAPKLSWQSLLLEKIPFFVASAGSCVGTYFAQKQGGAMRGLAGLSVVSRAENAVVSYSRYLGEFFFPTRLAVYYPYPASGYWPSAQVIGATVIVLAVTILALVSLKRRPYLPFGWFWFLGTLVPVIGLVQVGVQSMADRYLYIPSIGLLVMIIWGIRDLVAKSQNGRMAALAVAGVCSVTCAILTVRQIGYWKDGETLFRHVVAVTENNCVPHYLLGDALFKKGRLKEAAAEFQLATKLKSNYADPHNDLGMILSRQGRRDEAIAEFETAIKSQSDYPTAHYNLGMALQSAGRLDDAIREFKEAIRLKPGDADAHKNLAVALEAAGRRNDAMEELKRAAYLNPRDEATHQNLGILYGRNGEFDAAIREFQTAVTINPKSVDAHNYLGIALRGGALLDEAAAQFREALALQPASVPAHENLGDILERKGELTLAAAQYDAAIRSSRQPAGDHYRLGMILLKMNQREDAAAHFREALRLQPDFPDAAAQLRAMGSTNDAGK